MTVYCPWFVPRVTYPGVCHAWAEPGALERCHMLGQACDTAKAEALAKLMDMKSAMGVATLDVSTSDLVNTLKDTQATEIAGQIETTKVRVSSVQKETISPQIKKDMIAYLTQLRGDDELDIEQVANEFSTKVDELMVTQMQNVVDRE